MPAAAIDQRFHQFADQLLPPPMGSNILLAGQIKRLVQPPVGQRPLALFESQDQHGFIPRLLFTDATEPMDPSRRAARKEMRLPSRGQASSARRNVSNSCTICRPRRRYSTVPQAPSVDASSLHLYGFMATAPESSATAA